MTQLPNALLLAEEEEKEEEAGEAAACMHLSTSPKNLYDRI
jgi:hypothetical protein